MIFLHSFLCEPISNCLLGFPIHSFPFALILWWYMFQFVQTLWLIDLRDFCKISNKSFSRTSFVLYSFLVFFIQFAYTILYCALFDLFAFCFLASTTHDKVTLHKGDTFMASSDIRFYERFHHNFYKQYLKVNNFPLQHSKSTIGFSSWSITISTTEIYHEGEKAPVKTLVFDGTRVECNEINKCIVI